MTRFYFICPKTLKEFSVTFDVPGDRPPRGMFDLSCRHCGEMHRFYGRDVQKSRVVKKPRGLRL